MTCRVAVDGTWLDEVGPGTVVVQLLEGFMDGPEMAGDPFAVPLRTGEMGVPQVPHGRPLTVGMYLKCASHTDLLATWRNLATLMHKPRSKEQLVLTRDLDYGGGVVTTEARAAYRDGLGYERIQRNGATDGRMAVRLRHLDGYWLDPAESAQIDLGATATVTVGGDAPTDLVRIWLRGGGTGLKVLTNETLGVALSYNGETTSDYVLIDSANFTAVQGGENRIRNLNHAGDVFPMRLAPGDNEFSFSGSGTWDIGWKAAWL